MRRPSLVKNLDTTEWENMQSMLSDLLRKACAQCEQTSPDVSDVLPADLEAEVIGRLSVRRLLGVALDVAPPSYVPVTAQLRIGVAPGHAPGLVIDGVRQALSADPGGFFDRARWGFGQPLRGGVLIAAAGAVPGVAWVQLDTLSRRDTGVHGKDQLAIGPTEVLRLARGGLDVALGAAP